MRTYEVLYILTPQVPEEEATALASEFRSVIEKQGATIKNEEAWGPAGVSLTNHPENSTKASTICSWWRAMVRSPKLTAG